MNAKPSGNLYQISLKNKDRNKKKEQIKCKSYDHDKQKKNQKSRFGICLEVTDSYAIRL